MKVFLPCFILLCASCATETVITYPAISYKEKPQGVYVGVVSLGAEAEILTKGKPVFLNAEGSLFLQGLIHHWYEEPHESARNPDAGAINTLVSLIASEELPPNTDSLYLVMQGSGADAMAAGQTIGGKWVKTYTLDAGVEEIIDAIVARVEWEKTIAVYLVLNGEQSAESSFIAGLSEKAVSEAATPRTVFALNILQTPKKTIQIDGKTTGTNWLIFLGVIGIIAISAASVL
ncbi:MAG: hypothetical protein LBK25_01865 [Treponema sp.]|jgi:hypothetical protein|nr:hypothetical protein [Treponema sp.]